MRPIEEINAANNYHAFMRGWRDGATISAMRNEFTSHDNEAIKEAYLDGYANGRKMRGEASRAATKAYGYEPDILQLAEEMDK